MTRNLHAVIAIRDGTSTVTDNISLLRVTSSTGSKVDVSAIITTIRELVYIHLSHHCRH